MKVKELIKKLEKYDPNVEVSSGWTDGDILAHYDLIFKEEFDLTKNDDNEENIILWIGYFEGVILE